MASRRRKSTLPLRPYCLSWWEALLKTLILEGKGTQKVAESQGEWATLTHRQCLSADGRRKACSMSILAKLLLCVYLCKAVCVCFLYTEVFEVRSELPINGFYKSKGPAGLAERCLLAISWITSFISKYYPKCRTVDWLASGKQTFSHVPIGFFFFFLTSWCLSWLCLYHTRSTFAVKALGCKPPIESLINQINKLENKDCTNLHASQNDLE